MKALAAVVVGSALLVGAVAFVRPDGVSDTPLIAPAEGGGHIARGRNYVRMGTVGHEGEQGVLEVVSDQWPNGDKARDYVQDAWWCRAYQGQIAAFCVAGPGARFPNGTLAPVGALWLPGAVYTGDGPP